MLPRLALAALVLAMFGGWWTTPPRLPEPGSAPELPADLDAWLEAREAAVDERFGIVPGTGKRILWSEATGRKTDYAVVYLHGFSASRVEMAPVPELVARALGANLFETRLSGHGRQSERLAGIRAEDWLEDGVEALAVGRALGEKVVLIGTSTGATLALALAGHPLFDGVDTLVLVSPNLGLEDPAADWLTRPYGPLLARVMIGEYREWQAVNDAQETYWTTRYPTAAVVEMMRLLDVAEARVATARVPRALLVYSEKDRVVSTAKYQAGFEALPAGVKSRFEVVETSDPAFHVLAGDVLSPGSTQPVAARIADFVRDGRLTPSQADARPARRAAP